MLSRECGVVVDHGVLLISATAANNTRAAGVAPEKKYKTLSVLSNSQLDGEK